MRTISRLSRCCSRLLFFAGILFLTGLAPSSRAALTDCLGMWDFDGNFTPYWSCYSPVTPVGLTAGTDYSFASGGGFSYLQTQSFTTPAKRLQVVNVAGPNGGTGANRTNRWSIVMDVRFDSLSPFAGIVQLDPDNAADVTFYVNGSTGMLTGAAGALSGSGAIVANTWYRLALTCGNATSGGGLTVKAYLNGTLTGTRSSTYDGALAMRSSWLLLSDNNGEVRPAKVNSLGVWGEELTAANIATLGGPDAQGLFWPGFSYDNCPELTVTPAAALPSQSLSIHFASPAPAADDRVALFRENDALNSANESRRVSISAAGAPGSAPRSGTLSMPLSGIAPGCYWLHYLPRGGYTSLARVAVRVDAAVPALTVTPGSLYPGQTFSVSGAVEPGSPGVRILFKEGNKELPLRAVSVDEWGRFTAINAAVPADAPPGSTQVAVIPTGTTEPEKQTAPVTVTPVPTVNVVGQVRRALAGGGFTNVSGAVVMLYRENGEPAGTAITNGTGLASIFGTPPGNYRITCNQEASPVLNVSVPPGTTGTVTTTIDLPAVPAPVGCQPSAEILSLTAETVQTGLMAGSAPTTIGDASQTDFLSLANVGSASGQQTIRVKALVKYECATMSHTLVKIGGTVEFPIYDEQAPGLQFSMPSAYLSAPVHVVDGTVVNGDNFLRSFTVDLNVTNWPAGTPLLTVTAGYCRRLNDAVPPPWTLHAFSGSAWSYRVSVTDLRPRWRSANVDSVNITAAPDAATNTIRYNFTGRAPAGSNVAWEEDINLGLVNLENRLSLGIPIEESFFTRSGGYTGSARAEALLRLLGVDIVNESINFYSVPGSPDILPSLRYRTPPVNYPIFSACWPIPGLAIDARKCIKFCFVGCKQCVGISAGAFVCVDGNVAFEGRLSETLGVGATITPSVTLAAPVRIQIDAVICSGGGEIRPQLQFSLPVELEFTPSPSGGFGPGCVKLNAILNYYAECFGITFISGSKNLAEKTWGTCPAASPRSAANVGSTVVSPIVSPAIAVDGSCDALALWTGSSVMDGATNAGRLYFRTAAPDGTWSAPALVPTVPTLAESPGVAWLDARRFLCVWTHPKAKPTEPAAGTDPTMPAGLEIAWAIYNAATGTWTAPAYITNDNFWDIRPVIAGNGSGRATCVWQKLNPATASNPDVSVPMLLTAASFSGGSWGTPVTIAPTSPGVDYQPTVRYDALGNPGVAWLRDPDMFATSETQSINPANQSIWYSYKNGTAAWSTPQQVAGGLPAAAHSPSLDFDSANNPCLATVVPNNGTLDSNGPGAAAGNQNTLYFSTRRSGTWNSFQIRSGFHAPPLFVSPPCYAERPTLRIGSDNKVVIMFRAFGHSGGPHYSGDIGAATATLDPTGATIPIWACDYQTDDGLLNWQVAYDRPKSAACGQMIWVKADPDGTDPWVQTGSVDHTLPDPAILPGDFTIGNPHPLTGSSTTWTVTVTNRGLATLGAVTVELRTGSSQGTLLGTATTAAGLSLGGRSQVTITAAYPAGGQQRFFARVLPGGSEVTASNNLQELLAGGVAPPCNLTVSPAPGGGGTLLNWDPPAGTDNYRYRILRRRDGGDWEVIGYNLWDDFCDPTAAPGVEYEYAVVAEDVATGLLSDACAPGFVVLPGLIPNDPGPLPALTISERSSTAILRWGDTDPALYIERSTDMTAGSWRRSTLPTSKQGVDRTMTIPFQRPSEFFRLRRD